MEQPRRGIIVITDEGRRVLAEKPQQIDVNNERPTWLELAPHWRLAPFRSRRSDAAYRWPADLTDEAILAKLLELNLARAGAGKC